MPNKGYEIVKQGPVVKTYYYGGVSTATIVEVIDAWSVLKQKHNNLTIFVFDYSQAKMQDVETHDAVKIASHPIFSSDLLDDIYIVGILKEKRDYSLACLWATWLFRSNTFPGENVFLFRSTELADQKIDQLTAQLKQTSIA